jgi:hypothetical protein
VACSSAERPSIAPTNQPSRWRRTPRIGFLETAEEFLAAIAHVERSETPSFETGELARADAPLAVVPAAP